MLFNPQNEKERLAVFLADTLNDHKGLPLYLSYARRYPEEYLREILAVVKDVPLEKIRKSRGALFNYLVQKYAKQQTDNISRA